MSKKKSYGGVIFDEEGLVLLRRPTGGFGGCKWTFSKRGAEPDEEPEEAALRETREETGIEAEVVCRIPGTFEGSTSENVYFLMRVLSTGEPGWETEEIRWAKPDEARDLIRESPLKIVVERDIAVLDAALHVIGSSSSKTIE